MTNISYMMGSYIMFHYVRGIPFDFNAGAYDNLSLWEQIDHGDQYTPAKKFLLSVPVVLFLLSTHYTHYDLASFIINFLATLAVVIPKLPFVSSVVLLFFYSLLFSSLLRHLNCFLLSYASTYLNCLLQCPCNLRFLDKKGISSAA